VLGLLSFTLSMNVFAFPENQISLISIKEEKRIVGF